MMTERQLLWLWGKTVKGDSSRYHPLLFHMLDVGQVAAKLWDEVLPSRTRRRLAAAFGLDDTRARCLVILLTALHDLGKAHPGFQFQNESDKFGPQFLWERLKSTGLSSGENPKNPPHSFVSTKTLRTILSSGNWRWKADPVTAKVFAHITGAHHGTFPQSSDIVDYGLDVLGDAAWDDARRHLLDAVWDALCDDVVFESFESGPMQDDEAGNGGIVPLLSGFISVADWIGSSSVFEAAATYDKCPTIAEYVKTSRELAEEALQQFGWLPQTTFAGRRTFEEIFGFAPNSLQRKSIELSEPIDGPFLAIAEAAMGTGKTELALWMTDVALCRGIANGFYLGLPTQATSNAMHARLKEKYFATRGHSLNVDLQLAHGNALLYEQPNITTSPIYGDQDSHRPDRDNHEAAESWFAGRKRPLLAPFGVGTVDQGLMGVLQTSHWFVRLFGLAEKVVIFDEIHAYSLYMSTLFEQLLRWLKVLDCSVILLSATLPKSKRHAMLRAWGVEPATTEAPYPRLTWTSGNAIEAESHHIEEEALDKVVSITYAPTDPDQLAVRLRQELTNGGCIAIICNTVNRAQEVFKVLRRELADLVPPEEFHLLHARMPFAWRQDRERKILHKFGKVKIDRPQRAILVSTQILQESIDIDLDMMFSEMAPIDLLLQRLGREHRHLLDENGQPVKRHGHDIPEFVILCDAERDDGPPATFGGFEIDDRGRGVYERLILLRSWLALQNKHAFKIPQEIEPLIHAVYESEPKDLTQEWCEALDEARSAFEHRAMQAKKKAGNVVVNEPMEPGGLVDEFSAKLRDDEDPEVHESLRAATRDGVPSIAVVCLCQTAGGLFLPNEKGQPDLSQPINLKHSPPKAQASRLLQASLPLSHSTLYRTLRDEKVPSGWSKNPYLRFHRVLTFKEGVTHCAGFTLRLDAALGLVIEKEKDQEGD